MCHTCTHYYSFCRKDGCGSILLLCTNPLKLIPKIFGSCVLKASVSRYISRCVGQHSTDMLTDTQPICRPTLDQYIILFERFSADMLADIGRYLVEILADTRLSINRHVLNLVDYLSPLSVDTSDYVRLHSANTLTVMVR